MPGTVQAGKHDENRSKYDNQNEARACDPVGQWCQLQRQPQHEGNDERVEYFFYQYGGNCSGNAHLR